MFPPGGPQQAIHADHGYRSPRWATVGLLRFVHGLSVSLFSITSGRELLAILRSLELIVSRRPSYIVLYAGLVVVNLFILWRAFWRFGRRSLRASIISYLVWCAFFIWYGWYTDFAPFQLYTDYQLTPEEVHARLLGIILGAGFSFCAYALFPVLCYLDSRQLRRASPSGLL